MNRSLGLLFLVGLLSLGSYAQNGTKPDKVVPEKPVATVKDDPAMGLAKLALAAHGGDKLTHMRSLLVRGTVDSTSSTFNQPIPATFVLVTAGDRYRFELNNPIQPLKQIFDVKQTYTTAQGFSLPPMTSLGFPLLSRIGESGYLISGLPDAKKKKAGFRITTPGGYYTDFFVDEKTNQIKGYESSYDVDGRLITTSVEIEKFQIVSGLLVPDKYAQRFDLGT